MPGWRGRWFGLVEPRKRKARRRDSSHRQPGSKGWQRCSGILPGSGRTKSGRVQGGVGPWVNVHSSTGKEWVRLKGRFGHGGRSTSAGAAFEGKLPKGWRNNWKVGPGPGPCPEEKGSVPGGDGGLYAMLPKRPFTVGRGSPGPWPTRKERANQEGSGQRRRSGLARKGRANEEPGGRPGRSGPTRKEWADREGTSESGGHGRAGSTPILSAPQDGPVHREILLHHAIHRESLLHPPPPFIPHAPGPDGVGQ